MEAAADEPCAGNVRDDIRVSADIDRRDIDRSLSESGRCPWSIGDTPGVRCAGDDNVLESREAGEAVFEDTPVLGDVVFDTLEGAGLAPGVDSVLPVDVKEVSSSSESKSGDVALEN